MSIYYDTDLEAFFSIDHISYIPEYRRGKLVQHCYSGVVNIEYRFNPIDPKTQRLLRDKTCQWDNCYPAEKDTKERSEQMFQRSLIQHCMRNAKQISDDAAAKIMEQWNQAKKQD